MQIKRFTEAKSYEAGNTENTIRCDFSALTRAAQASSLLGFHISCQVAGAGPDSSPTEKVYLVLTGELTVKVGNNEIVLKQQDSCYIGPNETREIINRGNDVVTMLVVMSTPQT